MADLTTEQFAQRLIDVDLLDARQLDQCLGELGTREGSYEEFKNLLVRRELLTNFQADRLVEGKRTGYYYGDYKVLYMVGAGTFARVYRGVHRNTGEVAAIKVLRSRYSEDPERTEHFLREAEMVKTLRHANIVPVYEADSKGGVHYMIMEFVEGQNLRQFMKMRGILPVKTALRIARGICAGLDHAFKMGITHRDLKNSNILVSSRGVAKLVDFGLAAMEGTSIAEGAQTVGRSIDYAGLERASGVRKNDKRSDVFFAGAIFYHMIAGVPGLYETRDRSQRLSLDRYRSVKPILEVNPEVPTRLALIVNKALETDVDKRYQTPGEMLADIEAAIHLNSVGQLETQPTIASASQPTSSKKQSAGALQLEGENRTVMIIESRADVQDLFREKLKKRGYRVLIMGNPQRALARFDNDEHEDIADCVIFCLGELGNDAFNAFVHFAQDRNTAHIPCILLAEPAQIDFAKEYAPLNEHRVLVTMPIKMLEFRKVIYKLIQNKKPKPGAQ